MQRFVGAVQRLQLVQSALRFRVKARVLDGHRRAVRQRQQHPLFFAREPARLAIVDAKDPEHFAVDLDGHVE